MTRRLLTGLAALMLITSVAVAQGRPDRGPFRGGKLPQGVRVLEEGGGPGHGPQTRSQAAAIGGAVRQLAQRLDRLEKQVQAILAHVRSSGPGAQARRPDARRGMQGRRGMATRHGAPMDRGARLRRLLQARPELRQRLAQSPELRQRLAQRLQGQGQAQGQGRFQGRRMGAVDPRQMRGGRGMGPRAMRPGAMGPGAMGQRGRMHGGGEQACPHCGKGATQTKADPRRRAVKAKITQRAAHRPEGRGPAAARTARGAPMAGQRMDAENARLKAEIQKLQAQLARLAAEIRKLHGAR